MKNKKLKVLTVVGTRPEIIRLSEVIKELDQTLDHVLVHTGQNYDFELSEIFFADLGLKKPDYFLNAAGATGVATVGQVVMSIDTVLEAEKPDAFLVLGDTNSCLAAYAAKRRKIPVFHMEAGNRCFDQRVPEEINRKIIDHIADVNLVYSELARHNLLRENLPADRVIKTGSPMLEVLTAHMDAIHESSVLKDFKLTPENYFVVSVHREENVGDDAHFDQLMNALNQIAEKYKKPVIMSVHPRTAKRLKARKIKLHKLIKQMKPIGFTDYVALQAKALCVLSDSGTISEESSILNFPAVNIREAHERPEAMDEASVIMAGVSAERIIQAVDMATKQSRDERTFYCPQDYCIDNVSRKVARIIVSYTDYVNRVVWQKR